MRNLIVGLLLVATPALPAPVLAFTVTRASQAGSLSGVARGATQAVLPNQGVQLRNADTGQVVAQTTSSQTGAFTFASVPPGNYVVEIVDAAGRVVGLSSSVVVGSSAVAGVGVMATTGGAIPAASGGGFGILGLGSAASMAVIGAAGIAGTVVAVKAIRDDASPSR